MSIPRRTVPPAEPLLTLPEVKTVLGIDALDTDDDTLIQGYMASAEGFLDGYSGHLGRCLVTQTWEQSFMVWPNRFIVLPFPDVQSVVLTYLDENDVEQTVAAADYRVVEGPKGAEIWLRKTFAFPALADHPAPIKATMVCGFGAAAQVPDPIKTAAKALIAGWYDAKASVTVTPFKEVPLMFSSLVNNYRRVPI